MNVSNRAQQLHDKATRGEALSAGEQAELEQWYEQLDRAESVLLDVPMPATVDTNLQHDVQATLDQLHVVTQRIQELVVENEAVRREIAQLRRQLAQRPTPHAA